MLADSMRWAHLPSPGGIYQQHPEILDRFYYIFSERNKEEARRQAAERNKGGPGSPRVAGLRGR